MKKFLSVFLSILILSAVLPLSLLSSGAGAYGDLTYSVDVDRVAITSCSNTASGDIEIPSQIEGYPVTAIDYGAFKDCTDITGVTIPDTVTTIGSHAFEGCTGLKSIEIPGGVSYFDYTFKNCTSLESAVLNEGITGLGYQFFQNCTSLKNVSLPNSLEETGGYAFYGCTSLESIILPEGIKNIRYGTFEGCSNLTSVNIPEGVTRIEHSAFKDCTSLDNITIPEGILEIQYYVFENTAYYNNDANWEDDVLYMANCLIDAKDTIGPDYDIKPDTKLIASFAFDGCTNLESISIPEGIKEIYGTFEQCIALTSVTFPNSLENIGSYTFSGCTSLESIEFPSGVTEIGSSVFEDCTALKSVKFPEGFIYIGYYSFENCTSLESVYIPESVKSIDNGAFYDCSSLESIVLPDGIEYIGTNAFAGTAYYDNSVNWENGVLYIGKYLIKAKDTIYGNYDIKSGTIMIAAYAFDECTELTGVTIPEGVKIIGGDAFQDCTSLTSISIPESVTELGGYAFYGCTSLESIVLSDGIKRFGGWSFYNTAYANNSDNREDGVIYIGNYLIEVDDTISGSCEIKPGTIMIAAEAFYGCENLESVVIPESVRSIDSYAFENCRSLASIVLPDSVTYIGYEAFDYTSAYYNNEDNWEDDVLYIGNHLIRAKETISGSYEIKPGTKTIASGAFEYSVLLTSVNIPESVVTIGDYAFYDCQSLESLNISENITRIGDYYVFYNCNDLTLSIDKDNTYAIQYAENNRIAYNLTGETPDPTPEYGIGDVNKNGEIDSTDYTLVKRAYFGTYKLDESEFALADVNGNNEIDSNDYTLVKRVYFGTYKFD